MLEQSMRRSIRLCVLCALCSSPLLHGCTAVEAYRKCGVQGCAGDAKITREVETLLEAHPALEPPNQVYVQTVDGVVYLSGQVATDLQRTNAELVAREALGVTRVVDTIGLGYSGR